MDFAQQQDARDDRASNSGQYMTEAELELFWRAADVVRQGVREMMAQSQFNPTAWLAGLQGAVLTQQFAMDCPDAVLSQRKYTDDDVYWYASIGVAHVYYGVYSREYRIGIHIDTPIDAFDAIRYSNHLAQAARLCERFNRYAGRIPTIPAHVEQLQRTGLVGHLSIEFQTKTGIVIRRATRDDADFALIEDEIKQGWQNDYSRYTWRRRAVQS